MPIFIYGFIIISKKAFYLKNSRMSIRESIIQSIIILKILLSPSRINNKASFRI